MTLIEMIKAKAAEQQKSGGGYFNGQVSVNNPTGFNLTTAITKPNDAMKKAAHEISIVIPDGFTMPAHYLTPMTRAQINDWLGLFFVKKQTECQEKKGQFCAVKAMGYMYIELMNLAYVNGFATWDQLQAGYKEASAFLADVPEIPSFKEQLRNSGKVLVGAISGLISGGPVGLFAGIASTVGKIVAEERLKRLTIGQTIVGQNLVKVDEAIQTRSQMEFEDEKAKSQMDAAMSIGVLIVAGTAVYFLTD